MASNMSTYLSHAMLDWALCGTAFTPPDSVWIGLHIGAPTDSGTGGAEVVTTGGTLYERQQVTFARLGSRHCYSDGAIEFPEAGASWGGTINYFCLWDAEERGTGNLLWWGPVPTPRTVSIGEVFSWADSVVDLVMTGATSDWLATKVFDMALFATARTAPPGRRAALWVGDPTSSGTEGVEVSEGGYSRQDVSFWPAENQACYSDVAVGYGPAAEGGWGTLTHGAVWDSASTPHMLFSGVLGWEQEIAYTQYLRFPAGWIGYEMK